MDVREYLSTRTDRFRNELLNDILKDFPEMDPAMATYISWMATEKHVNHDVELVDYVFNKIQRGYVNG